MFPHLFNQWRGRLCQGGKEKFVTRLAFRRARGQRRNEEAVTSLKAYRVEFIGSLTEYPGTDNEKVGTSKCGLICRLPAVEFPISRGLVLDKLTPKN